jgi:hypothetical protein
MTARLPSTATYTGQLCLMALLWMATLFTRRRPDSSNGLHESLLDSNPFNGEYKDVKRALEMKRIELKSSWLNSAKSIIAGIFRYTFEEIESVGCGDVLRASRLRRIRLCGRKLEPGDPG